MLTRAFVTKVNFEGKRAIGVTYRKDRQELKVTAAKETILSPGALRTPQMLQLSGIGPADLLKRYGIEVVHELKGVGEHLMDHVQVGRKFSTNSKYTFNKMAGNIFTQGLNGLRYHRHQSMHLVSDADGPDSLRLQAAAIHGLLSGSDQMGPPHVGMLLRPAWLR